MLAGGGRDGRHVRDPHSASHKISSVAVSCRRLPSPSPARSVLFVSMMARRRTCRCARAVAERTATRPVKCRTINDKCLPLAADLQMPTACVRRSAASVTSNNGNGGSIGSVYFGHRTASVKKQPLHVAEFARLFVGGGGRLAAAASECSGRARPTRCVRMQSVPV